jgi:hypothetical protein
VSVKDELLAGEAIVFETEKHWVAPIRDSVIPVLLLVGAYIVGAITPNADGGVFGFLGNLLDLLRTGLVIVGVGWIAYNIIVWRTATFAVTNHRVIREEGLISRRSSATMLPSVTDVQSRVPFIGSQLGFGDLVIFTQSGEAGADRFRTITDPKTFRDRMMAAKLDAGRPASAAPASVAPAAADVPGALAAASVPALQAAPAAPIAPAADDHLATLARLAELRDAGAITPEEFEAKKVEILARI